MSISVILLIFLIFLIKTKLQRYQEFFDYGVSTHQISSPSRGFSFQLDGPLDMRMDTESGVNTRMF